MEMDPKKKVIQELMEYLKSKDDEDLGGVMKPKGLEITKVGIEGGKPEDGSEPDSGDMVPKGMSDGDGDEKDSSSGMNDDELNELIEAISQKMGK